jgi:hypothetical protein
MYFSWWLSDLTFGYIINSMKHYINSINSYFLDLTNLHSNFFMHILQSFFFRWLSQPIQSPSLLFSSLIIFSQTVGLLGRVISQSQGRYLNTGQHKQRINAYTHQTSMP